jgi:DNA-binding phage protein
MKPDIGDQDPIQEEVRQLMELLRVTARTLGFNNAALARQADVPIASLVRYFKGDGEPKLEFLLAVVRALGLEVREFFELAYPALETPTRARVKMGKIFGPIQPGKLLEPPPPPPKPEPKPEPLKREDVERMMEQLRADVRAILDKQSKQKKKEPPPEPEEPKPPKKNGES